MLKNIISTVLSYISFFYAENKNAMKLKIKKYLTSAVFVSFSVFLCPEFLYADTTHVVQKGETLYSISRKYGSTVQSISNANGISGTDIKVGQKLIIPGDKDFSSSGENVSASLPENSSSSTYTVNKGDTWYAISRKFSITLSELYALNNADSSTGLKAGQKIKIPAQTKSSPSSYVSKKTETSENPSATLPPSSALPDVSAPIVDTHSYSSKKGDPNLVWPVEKPDVTYVNGKVSGVTLIAKKDEPVKAIKSGTVMFCGSYRGFGNVVFIQSKTGHIYAYTGLGEVLVNKGDYIDYQKQIGTVGIDSYSSKNQISLMVFQNGLPVDPSKAPRG